MHLQRQQPSIDPGRTWRSPQMKQLSLVVLGALGHLPSIASASPGPSPEPAPEPSPEPMVAQFEQTFLGQSAGDVSRFERGNPVFPGNHTVDVYLNQDWLGREPVSFRAPREGLNARPCLTGQLLLGFGLDMMKVEAKAPGSTSAECVDIEAAIPDARVSYDSGEMRLDLSIPQAFMTRHARGYVDPKYWDDGVTAAMINYTFNAYRSDNRVFGDQLSASVGLDAGLNLGGWRLRQQSFYIWNKGQRGRRNTSDWQNTATYAQHDVTPLSSQLTLGDATTSGEIFDSFAFRGARLASDTRMLPDSLVGYAPTVRGVAQTNARVEIRQNGYIIYETTVSPGPFEIDDLAAGGYGGDLEVTVVEADGRVSTFSVPYANVPQLLRPGTWRYSATVGQMRSALRSSDGEPLVAEGTYQRGINNALTLYGGAQVAEKGLYSSALAGAAFNTPVGAFAADITYSSAKLTGFDDRLTGRSARVTYAKTLPQTRTDFALAAYRYSSKGFLALPEAVQLDDSVRTGFVPDVDRGFGRQRSRFQLSLSQRLGDRGGALYASGSRNDYWDRQTVDSSYQLGYANSFRSLSYSLSASRTRDLLGRNDNQYFVSFRVPLGAPTGSAADSRIPSLSVSADRRQQGNTFRTTIAGTAGENSQVNYAVSAAGNGSSIKGVNDANVGANLQYAGSHANLGASYTYARSYQQASVNAGGGVVIHPGGVTFSQSLGDTIAVVHAKDAVGARVSGQNNLKLDRRGYAVVSYLMPYRMNTVQLDPKGLSTDIELGTTLQRVAPRAGSVVSLSYATSTGRAFMVRGLMDDGKTLPFGAQVMDEHGIEVGVVGQGGRAFVRTNVDSGRLTVKWGGRVEDACSMDYKLPASRDTTYQQLDAQCTFKPAHATASL